MYLIMTFRSTVTGGMFNEVKETSNVIEAMDSILLTDCTYHGSQWLTPRMLSLMFTTPLHVIVRKNFDMGDEWTSDRDKCGAYLIGVTYSAAIKDVIGGVHDEGMGWAPDGTFCGECSNLTCEGCSQADIKKET